MRESDFVRAAFFDEVVRLLQHTPLRVIAEGLTGANQVFTRRGRILGLPEVQSAISSGRLGGYHLLRGVIPRANPNARKADNLG